MKKKAIIEVQLNWIYILIVGAIILVFFVVVAKKYAANAELKISSQILENLDTTVISATQAA